VCNKQKHGKRAFKTAAEQMQDARVLCFAGVHQPKPLLGSANSAAEFFLESPQG
jgi:hypothetical protein